MLHILDRVLDDAQLARVNELVAAAGYVDGSATAGYRARRVKHNRQAPKEDAASREIGLHVLNALDAHSGFQRHAIPKQALAPIVSRYEPGMSYGAHVDEPFVGTMPRIRADLALTLFLSPAESYDGGALVLETPVGEHSVRLEANQAVLYPANMLHRVEPVTRGVRLAAITWVQSHVRDAARRELLADMLAVAEELHRRDPEAPATDLAYRNWSNLMRMWAEN